MDRMGGELEHWNSSIYLYKFKVRVVMHYAVKDRGYDYLSRRLCMYSNNHNYDTRTSNLFVLPRYRISKSKRRSYILV